MLDRPTGQPWHPDTVRSWFESTLNHVLHGDMRMYIA